MKKPNKAGSGKLKQHVEICFRKDLRDIEQFFLNDYLSLKIIAFNPVKFDKFLSRDMVRHHYHLSFVELIGIRVVLSYLR